MNRRRGKLERSGRFGSTARPSLLGLVGPVDPVEELIARARRSRTKGDLRRALVLLREACSLDEWRARSWTLNGALLEKIGQRAEAARAYRQARWLRSRAGERSRVDVLDRLIARVATATT